MSSINFLSFITPLTRYANSVLDAVMLSIRKEVYRTMDDLKDLRFTDQELRKNLIEFGMDEIGTNFELWSTQLQVAPSFAIESVCVVACFSINLTYKASPTHVFHQLFGSIVNATLEQLLLSLWRLEDIGEAGTYKIVEVYSRVLTH